MFLAETPLPGTLQVLAGSLLLGSSVYAVNGHTITFLNPQGDLSVRSQTSPLTANSLVARENYSSPYLSQFSLESAE